MLRQLCLMFEMVKRDIRSSRQILNFNWRRNSGLQLAARFPFLPFQMSAKFRRSAPGHGTMHSTQSYGSCNVSECTDSACFIQRCTLVSTSLKLVLSPLTCSLACAAWCFAPGSTTLNWPQCSSAPMHLSLMSQYNYTASLKKRTTGRRKLRSLWIL